MRVNGNNAARDKGDVMTVAREHQMHDFLEKLNLTERQYDIFFKSSHLKNILFNCKNLSKFNGDRFKSLLNDEPVEIPWTPTNLYLERIMKRSDERKWGLTEYNARSFTISLREHFSSLMPTGVNIWLGKSLEFNWTEAMIWLKDEVGALGYDLKVSFDASRLFFRSNFKRRDECGFHAIKLNLAKFWDPVNGVAPWDVLRDLSNWVWPDLAIPFSLALNPQVCINMDGKTIPYMWASGLTIDSNSLPIFYRDEARHTIHIIYDYKIDDRLPTSSMVAYA